MKKRLFIFGLLVMLMPGISLNAQPDAKVLSFHNPFKAERPVNGCMDSANQRLSGKVTDQGGKTIPYVNIGIPGSSVGTVSNKDEVFKLTIPEPHQSDTLKFSAVG